MAHPNAGGAEVYTDRVATEWVRQGHEVTLFASAVFGLPAVDRAPGGYTILRRGSRHGVYRAARRFWRREGNGNFDLVIDEVNTRPFGCPRYVVDVPVVAIIHQVCKEIWGYETRWPISWIGRYLLEPYWLSWYKSVPVIAPSESSKESLRDFGIENISIVPVGTSADEAAGVRVRRKESDPTLVFVGRLAANKRPCDALAVHRFLAAKIPNLKLWVIGTGPLEDLVRSHVSEGVTFYGRCDEETKRDLVARAHVLLGTSVREGWGLVVTEAARQGTVACGYDVPGLRDSVLASGGMLSRDTPQSLAKVVGEMLKRVNSGEVRPRVAGVAPWDEVSLKILGVSENRRRLEEVDEAQDAGAIGRVARRVSWS